MKKRRKKWGMEKWRGNERTKRNQTKYSDVVLQLQTVIKFSIRKL